MIKYLFVLMLLVALVLQAQSLPAESLNTPADAIANEKSDAIEALTDNDDLNGSETFGFGYYPGFYGGYGYGRRFRGYGYGLGWGYGGYGGYGGGFGYGGYYRRPIYPVFG